jgi:hypothetical protein
MKYYQTSWFCSKESKLIPHVNVEDKTKDSTGWPITLYISGSESTYGNPDLQIFIQDISQLENLVLRLQSELTKAKELL